jgi:hypothetical protein
MVSDAPERIEEITDTEQRKAVTYANDQGFSSLFPCGCLIQHLRFVPVWPALIKNLYF